MCRFIKVKEGGDPQVFFTVPDETRREVVIAKEPIELTIQRHVIVELPDKRFPACASLRALAVISPIPI